MDEQTVRTTVQSAKCKVLSIFIFAILTLLVSYAYADESDELIRMSEVYRSKGHYQKAIEALKQANKLALSAKDTQKQARIAGFLGMMYQLSNLPDKASEAISTGFKLATVGVNNHSPLQGFLKYCEGQVLSGQQDEQGALSAYLESAKLSEGKSPDIHAKSLLRACVLYHKAGKDDNGLLKQVIEHIHALEPSHDKAHLLIAAGELSESFSKELFQNARETAESICDLRALSYALGHLSTLYEREKRYEESLSLARKATFAAQEADAPESLYRWEWQTGRLLKVLGDQDGAIAAYRLAVRHLEAVRQDMSLGCQKGQCSSFREVLGPMYFEMADLLLQRSAVLTDQKKIEEDLKDARAVIEQLKTVELQDYFQDDCVTALRAKSSSIDQFHTFNAAAIYPILLPNRIELLVSLPDGLKRFTVNLSSDELTELIRAFRAKLENPESRFLRNAQKLYDYLIRPLDKELESRNIATLVFVPDGALRTIPMSALHDGERFLIEKYSVAVTPGLTLTDPKTPDRRDIRLLLNGLTESVQGFSSLPNVNYELQSVHAMYKSDVLRDKAFTVSAMSAAFETVPYSIVHIASHGQFDKDPKKTFLLTHDDKLTMDKLEQLIRLSELRKEPVELLTLSACQTAVGDDRAALGLAGVAVKAGARSALATLWFIDDASTSKLITEFYQLIRQSGISKAEALRTAQVRLLKTSEFGHPAYWAPFLLIGGWL